MSRIFSFVYGIACYLIFLGNYLYFIGFVGDFWVPRAISSESSVGRIQALLTDVFLMTLFGVQHSGMARTGFRTWITRLIPKHLERSTYVLVSSVVLTMLMWLWQPIHGVIWEVKGVTARTVLYTIFGLGWILILISTFLTDHFDLFGVRQVYLYLMKKPYTDVPFTDALFYKWTRHPMMLGLFIAFWSIPTMTAGHLLFSAGMSLYIIVGIRLEERNYLQTLGEQYRQYRQRTPMIFPMAKR
jgi:protein-S-isoprenylcysteine O-methyltransferase Ste14